MKNINAVFCGINVIQMNYIAQEISTGILYFSKGADKLARLIGISATTITRNAKYSFTEKVYNGFVFAKTKDLPNESRGKPYLR